MKRFLDTIEEASKDAEYRLVVLTASDPEDPNATAVEVLAKAKKMGIDAHIVDFCGMYLSEKDGKEYLHSFDIEEDGKVIEPTLKNTEVDYRPPVEINPQTTLIMCRGIGDPGVTANAAWENIAKDLEYRGYTLINSVKCHDICKDKHHNQIIFNRHNIRTPKTSRVNHPQLAERAFDNLKTDFPIILKTSTGSQGVGVLLVESMRALTAITQILDKQNEFVSIILQEFIETKYDVRTIVCNGEIVASMKRPVVKGDFRSNVAQGSKPEKFKLTKHEAEECVKVAELFEGTLVGVDFIPAEDRESGSPIFIEVNAEPGLVGIEEAHPGTIETILNKLKSLDRKRK